VSRDVNGLRSALVSPTRSALRRLRLPAAGEQIRDIPRQLAAHSGEYAIGAKPGIDASNSTASARHYRGWSVARMIDSRAGATRM